PGHVARVRIRRWITPHPLGVEQRLEPERCQVESGKTILDGPRSAQLRAKLAQCRQLRPDRRRNEGHRVRVVRRHIAAREPQTVDDRAGECVGPKDRLVPVQAVADADLGWCAHYRQPSSGATYVRMLSIAWAL